MRKIIFSIGTIAFVAAAAWGATGAFFSDSEVSTGNVLAAGAIDLKIDNESYVTSTTTGQLVASPNTSWTMRNLTIEKFFNFEDVKPGDIGEDTISLHVDNNDAWLCADVTLTSNNENTLVDPEVDDGDVSTTTGELADQVNFAWWADDGDNVLESDEELLSSGPIGALEVGATTTVTLADSGLNIWGDLGPIPGASTRYLGKAWCFGEFDPAPVTQDGLANTGTNGPLVRGTGFVCDGSPTNNKAQTDSLTADVTFRAIQSRNNSQFVCSVTSPVDPNEINQSDLATTTLGVGATSWFFYNDTNDTVMDIDQTSGTSGQNHMELVAGEVGAKMVLGTEANPRYNIATAQFGGTLLNTISPLNFRVYDATADSDTPFLQFNVDFATTTVAVGYQGRLTMQPGTGTNAALPASTWTTVDAIDGGNAMWTWSKFAVGPDLVAGGVDNAWPDGNTNQYRTWNDIITSIPTAKLLTPGTFFGVRTGQPGPSGATNFVSSINFDGTVYDFEI